MSISAFLPVFNEEKRILHTITSLQWCDEVILLDKNSTDKTVEIAKEFGKNVKIHFMENSEIYDATEFDFLIKYCTSKYVIIFTASDVIDKQLALEIKSKTGNKEFDYDKVFVPYKRYVLGLETKHSPWYTDFHPAVWKKTSLNIDKAETHAVLDSTGNSYYIKNTSGYMYHLTHETVDGMTFRHIRYWRSEGLNYNQPTLKNAFKSVLGSVYTNIFKRRVFMMGWDGVALACAHMSYFMMAFVYKWENKKGKDHVITKYKSIRNQVNSEWANNNNAKV